MTKPIPPVSSTQILDSAPANPSNIPSTIKYHPSGQLVKYRPAFTLDQLTHISHAFQLDKENETSKSIVRILIPLLSKINSEIIEPAYKLAPPRIEKEIPKIVKKPTYHSDQYRYENDLMSVEEQNAYEAKILGID